MENRKNIFEMMNEGNNNLEKQIDYLTECIHNSENTLIEHLTFLYNLRVKLTLRFIAKYNKYPNVKKYYKN